MILDEPESMRQIIVEGVGVLCDEMILDSVIGMIVIRGWRC
jgi:hypothetical protein